MKGILTTLLLILGTLTQSCTQENKQASQLLKRLLPNHSEHFDFKTIPSANGNDVFELSYQNGRVIIAGNNGVSMARGLKHYLNQYCNSSTSWCGENLNLPNPLPEVVGTIKVESPFEFRYYLNYCTHSYSMVFWDWERWEKEIDWMALNGINLPLAITGQSKVWQNTMLRMGFTEKEVFNFLPGPAFEAWWLMGNLEGWGGKVPQSYIDDRAELQKKIVNRMRELGIQPALQAFYGMVPNASIQRYPDADIRDVGTWCGYRRPAFLNPTDSLFESFAKVYYEEQTKLYGESKFYAGDPFHEGGHTKGINVKKAGGEIYRLMEESHTQKPKWVLQAWQNNPRQELLEGIPNNSCVVIDLWAEVRPQWGGVKSFWKRPDGFVGKDWIWSIVPNFGGNIGTYGKLSIIANDVPEAMNHPKGKEMSGLGTAMEGIGTNPVIYDLLYDLAWEHEKVDLEKWINQYALSRYGQSTKESQKAWSLMLKSVYSCPRDQGSEGCPESVLCARPSTTIRSASSWGSSHIYYSTDTLVQAIDQLLKSKAQLSNVDTYQFDVVDYTRQLLAIRGQELHHQMVEAINKKDYDAFEVLSTHFLELIADQDKLLSTRKEFLLGEWIEMARNIGQTEEEKDFYEWNARTQVTTWGDRHAANKGGLHEYAHKEWAGLLADFYLPRWEMFISRYREQLKGSKVEPIDWYAWEEAWTKKQNPFATQVTGDAVATALVMFEKYR